MSWLKLLSNVVQALQPAPWWLPRSIVGDPDSWSMTRPAESEFSLLHPCEWDQGLRALWSASVPGWPGRPQGLQRILPDSLFRESAVWPFPCVSDPPNRWPRESWLFINGICTDTEVLELNARMLHRLFGRPLTLLHNQTSGIALDLAECALGKGWLHVTEAVRKLFPTLLSELVRGDIDKVVLIAHSQGTILAAVFLHLLRQLAGIGTQSPASPEARCAAAMLLAPLRLVGKRLKPPKGRHCRVLNPATPGRFEPYCPCHPQIEVAAWMDWGPDAVLALPKLDPAVLKKLEIYAFATCASDFQSIDDVPYLEHFGNEHDMVARLGMLAPREGCAGVRINGRQFLRPQAWGHLLNAHYLAPLESQFIDPQRREFEPHDASTIPPPRLSCCKARSRLGATEAPVPATPCLPTRLLAYWRDCHSRSAGVPASCAGANGRTTP